MKSTEKKELSYFRLKLGTYLNEHFPEMLGNNPLIIAWSDEALTAYCDAVAQGFSYPEANSMARQAKSCIKGSISPDTIPLFPSWNGSSSGNFRHLFPKDTRRYRNRICYCQRVGR